MAEDDWYRGTDWSVRAQERFTAKLARARPANRAQYLRIKGAELAAADAAETRAAGRDLLRRVLADHPDDALQATWARRDLGASLAQDGELNEAAAHLSAALRSVRPEPSAAVELAEVILAAGWRERYREAQALLVGAGIDDASAPFPVTRFRWNLAAARLSARLGERDDARELAAIALRCLQQTESPFPRHRALGLANADAGTLSELKKLARRRRRWW